MTTANAGPVLACYDGSEGSRLALHAGGAVLGARDVVVLTVWQSLATQLAMTGSFQAPSSPSAEVQLDSDEQTAAQAAAEEGAQHARESGFRATARVEQTGSAVWRTIVDVANELDAQLILCGTRGRGSLETALLGGTSHGVLNHAHRPVLIVPEPHTH